MSRIRKILCLHRRTAHAYGLWSFEIEDEEDIDYLMCEKCWDIKIVKTK